MTDQGQRTVVCVHDIPVSLDEVRRSMKDAPIKDESGTFTGTTEGMGGALPTSTFEVEMRDGSRSEVAYPFVAMIPEEYVVEVMEGRLQPFKDELLSSEGVTVRAAHPRIVGDQPVDFLVTFADFVRAAEEP
jgi:hypothetical protein